uniref:Ferredoxin n=1 Tax=Alexandrium andersonii TaxID=327968 RepID=A0A7S2F1N6_9DINO
MASAALAALVSRPARQGGAGLSFLAARRCLARPAGGGRAAFGAASAGVGMAPAHRSRRLGGLARRYKVTLETPSGEETFECPEGTFILDQAEDLGIELPYSCRTGQCSICTGKVLEGTIDQSSQTFLTEEQVSEDYCLTCVTSPTSDCRVRTHCDNDVTPIKVTAEDIAEATDLGLFDSDGEESEEAAMF